MAITHKKNDELEKMLAGFASIPSFDKPLEVNTDGKLATKEKTTEQTKPSKPQLVCLILLTYRPFV
ncbi:TPA: hypothetical protein VMA25_000889 [Streptococcus pyogenes]|nr:hypothetical protein [Streptococcus pyogenes]HEQ7794313.1 hypothetical protein [Streptococcus pyogenes]HEQ7802224.1 hypothetical protein [Streptococcus pyogenes]HER0019399.1 hypothetical protein [Streptococcus pyogenes]HER7056263.1 hypothetical protein [Streptococcus pyogenes]